MTSYKKRRSNKLYAQLKKAGVEPLDAPGKIVFVNQSSVLCGVALEQLESLFHLFDVDCELIVYPTSKSYSFVLFSTLDAAESAYERLNGTQPDGFPQPLQLVYVDRVPASDHVRSGLAYVEGLWLLPEFVSEAEEAALVEFLECEAAVACCSLKNRVVLHYGYAFDYSSNAALKPCAPIPPCLLDVFERGGHNLNPSTMPDQVTVNVYEPGQGIPPHVDTHSAFEEPIFSLSLLSPVVMEFRDSPASGSTGRASVLLPRRSLLLMEGAARYRYKHGILSRKHDVNPLNSRLMTRGRRISVTYRRVRRQPCECPYPEWCDWAREGRRMAVPSTSESALEVEGQYVVATYASIAHHFDETRVANWSAVGRFLDDLDEGALLLDAGCGNGKYLLRSDRCKLVKLGCDLCEQLVRIAKTKQTKSGGDVAVADLLQLPYRDAVFDACLCVAVLHHLSTEDRRLAAVTELVRLLKHGGRAIITVWAMEQRRMNYDTSGEGGESAYARMKYKKDREPAGQQRSNDGKLLRIHEGGADFKQQDLLIPWHLTSAPPGSGGKPPSESSPETRYRYYHLFIEGELESLIAKVSNCKVISTSYEEGNWIAVLERTLGEGMIECGSKASF